MYMYIVIISILMYARTVLSKHTPACTHPHARKHARTYTHASMCIRISPTCSFSCSHHVAQLHGKNNIT